MARRVMAGIFDPNGKYTVPRNVMTKRHQDPQGNPWVLTASGIAFDLIEPMPAMVSFRDMAGALARSARFNGHVASFPYSVAQHSVIGADYFLARGMETEARWFLLHDAHEAYTGDIATPIKAALEVAAALASPMQDNADLIIRRALRLITERIDRAIHEAAGLTGREPGTIKLVDAMLLMAERNQLMPRSPKPWSTALENTPPLPIRGRIRAISWPEAEAQFLDRLARLFPQIRL